VSDGQPDPELTEETRNDKKSPDETRSDNDDGDAVIDELGSALGQVVYASDPPPTSSAPPPPMPVPKKRFRRER
jgi:hypothetical protein